MSDEAVDQARAGYDEAQRSCGTSDVVARVRRMPDGSVDVAWLRRGAVRSRLRLGSLAGTQPQLSRLATKLERPAPRGCFYAIHVSAMDDSDATLEVVARKAM